MRRFDAHKTSIMSVCSEKQICAREQLFFLPMLSLHDVEHLSWPVTEWFVGCPWWPITGSNGHVLPYEWLIPAQRPRYLASSYVLLSQVPLVASIAIHFAWGSLVW
jgi:hypothetical protein